MDPASGKYNSPLLSADLELVPGYRRLQGIVYRKGDRRFGDARRRRNRRHAGGAGLSDG